MCAKANDPSSANQTYRSASSERDLPRVNLTDMQTGSSVALAMEKYYGPNPKYHLSQDAIAMLDAGLSEEQAKEMQDAWTSKNLVDNTIFFKKGNTRILDKIVGPIHAGSYDGRRISLFLQWEEVLKRVKTKKDVVSFLETMTPTQQSLMAIAVYLTTGETKMQSYVCGLQTAQSIPSSKRPRSPSPSSSRRCVE